jgi:hypothetical protein
MIVTRRAALERSYQFLRQAEEKLWQEEYGTANDDIALADAWARLACCLEDGQEYPFSDRAPERLD